MEIETIDLPNQELIDFFQTKIDEFNLARWEVKEKMPLAIRLKNKNGDIVAVPQRELSGYGYLSIIFGSVKSFADKKKLQIFTFRYIKFSGKTLL
jgi:hypothetical protein